MKIKTPRRFQRNPKSNDILECYWAKVLLVLLIPDLQATYTLFSENKIRIQRLQSVCLQIWRVSSKPSLKIGTVNAICWNSLGLLRDHGLNYIFFRNQTFLFFNIETWNFQHLFEKEFRETSESFNSIRQRIEKMEIKNIWIRWMSWNFVRFFTNFFFKQMLKVSAFYLAKTKKFYS